MTRYASTALASFMRTAELGSFAAAGRALGISSAAVGQNVKRLEVDAGVKLFNRTTRMMSLTPEGSLLFERAREPLKALEDIDHLFQESRGLVAGRLRLSAPKHFAYKTLVPLLIEFCAAHPLVEIDLDASDAVRDFVDDPVDVAFRIGDPADSTMIARTLSRLPVYTLASPSYLERHGTPIEPGDLQDHNCLQFRFQSSREVWVWAFQIGDDIRRVRTPGKMIFNDPEALLAAGVQGAGIFQMDGSYAGDHVRAGLLVPLMLDLAPDMQALNLCYASREHLPLRVRAFVNFVLDRIERDCFSID
ncbi:MAG: LysR family transcriptional regulator [Pseudomonadota bacterium]